MRVIFCLLASFTDAQRVHHENFYNDYDSPDSYDKSKCPNATVLVDAGLFYIALIDMGK